MKTVGAYRHGDEPYVVLCNASPPIFRRALDPRGTRSKVSLAVTIIPAIVDGIGARYRRRLSTNRFDGTTSFFRFQHTIYPSVFFISIFLLFPQFINAIYFYAMKNLIYFLPEAWYVILNVIYKVLLYKFYKWNNICTYN